VSIGESVSTLRDVARALAYAHGRGIVHRDIKPDNVLLSGGSATVTDFGIAKAISAARTDGGAGGETLTQVGTSIGTPAYMAPEQAAGDPDTDHRADLYAFGVMAYEVLAGRPPFVAATPTKLLAAHMSEVPRDLLEFRPDCPVALRDMVMQCLAKEPLDRPQGATALVRVLDSVTSSGSGAEVPAILHGGPIRLGRALGMWAVATSLVVVTAWAAREAIGLPDWVFPGAIGVMLAGLPVLGFTAYAQRLAHRAFTATPHRTPAPQGTMQTLALKASPHLSWRRTWLGGAIAVGGFAALVIGFMVLRAMGIGPMASLRGQGAFGESETIMVADFGSPAGDSTLGATVAEALRTDLAQSNALSVVTRAVIREQLTLMQRAVDTVVPYDLAQQIASREGAKAVLDGSIQQLGQSYVISARLVPTLGGGDLASFRQEAANQDELLTALGKLARDVRAKAGESLRTIRASSELERVTTPSLPALRKYVEGSRLADERGEIERGIALVREAVALDTAFAMAWRKLAVLLNNEGRDREGMLAAISTAYRHRERLTHMERLLTEGFYFTSGPTPDRNKALAAYEEAARIDTLNTSALNNAAVVLGDMHDYVRAESLYRRVVRLPRTFGGAFSNLLQEQIRNRRSAAALDSTVAAYRAAFPESNDLWEAEWFAAWGKGNVGQADSIARAVSAAPKSLRQVIRSSSGLASTSEMRGKIADAAQWASRGSQALFEAQSSPANRFNFVIDTAYFEMFYGTKAAALAALARGRSRVPMEDIPPSERPWDWLKNIGSRLGEPSLVREALAGWERDQAALTPEPEARRAHFQAHLAFAERRWADVIVEVNRAEARYAFQPRGAAMFRGYAYQGLGQVDSAIASFERFLDTPDPLPDFDGAFKADALQRLGELHEAKGDRAKAMEYYEQFTALWGDADAKLQPRVREIRGRIERLRREIG
jgi:tetratricopeptide (TPR) repeat protein